MELTNHDLEQFQTVPASVAASFCVPFVSGKKSSDLKSASTLACKVCTMVICFWF
ncbi:hypothetical protein PVAP13_6KG097435 [Panicum virgatum]|uniref:Uncharacterized protein n=1 Tax=Panicum virgatum TaxID=38727 RepID=A0A8T0R926_PANVG|nr:hypothetical protein PVAP13_6KG097435 [Panicum virgatum]